MIPSKADRVYDLIRSNGESQCRIGTLHLQLLLLLLLCFVARSASQIFAFFKHFVVEMHRL